MGDGLVVDLGEAAFLATLRHRSDEPHCVENPTYGF
jgi:hypothetical protein